jgi:hypothetical protein
MLLGLPTGQARLANHLDEAARQFMAELAARQEADAEMEALQTSAARVWTWCWTTPTCHLLW